MYPVETSSGNKIIRALLPVALVCCWGVGSAKQNTFLSIIKTTPEVYRPGWPPGLWVTLEDWRLHGPVLEVVATQEGSLVDRETLKFDEQGRLVRRSLETPYHSSEDLYFYQSGRLVETLQLYEDGEVVRSNYQYDARGYLTNEINIKTTDVEKFEKFRTEKFPDAVDLNRKFIEKAKADGPAVREVTYEYGASGLIVSEKCVRKSANAVCPAEYREYTQPGKRDDEQTLDWARYTYDQRRNWTLREELPNSAGKPVVTRRQIRYRS